MPRTSILGLDRVTFNVLSEQQLQAAELLPYCFARALQILLRH